MKLTDFFPFGNILRKNLHTFLVSRSFGCRHRNIYSPRDIERKRCQSCCQPVCERESDEYGNRYSWRVQRRYLQGTREFTPVNSRKTDMK